MTPRLSRRPRALLLVVVSAFSCSAGASAQTSLLASDTSHAVTLAGSVASGYAVGTSPGVLLSVERALGPDRRGREVRLRVQGGVDRLRLEAGSEPGAYVRHRHVAIGVARYADAGPRGGVDPYVFAQVGRRWLVERQGTARARGIAVGVGLDVAPVASTRSVTVEYELALSDMTRLPGGRSVGPLATRRLHIGYKRRF